MRILLLILPFTLFIMNCQNEPGKFEVSSVPLEFTKKVLIEEFTGTWCGFCPDGAYILETLIDNNDGKVIGVGLHKNDAMAIPHTNYLENNYNSRRFPSGMVDRVSYNGNVSLNRGYWEYITNIQLSDTTVCGLAIKSEVNGEKAIVDVHAGFNTNLSGNYRLSVYLIEDDVSETGYGYDQANYYNTDSSSPFYELGNPIENYEHNHILRAVLSESLGDKISTSALISGGEHIETYTVDLSPYNDNNLSIIAFINYVGTTFKEHEIMNVQACKIDDLQDWD